MRFLDEQGTLHAQPPKSPKAAKLWILGLEWQSVDKGAWGAVARDAASFKAVRGAVAMRAQKRQETPGTKSSTPAMHVGLWSLTFAEEEELKLALPRCYSLAAVFALAAQSQNQARAALYLDLGQIDGVNHAYFSRLFNGVPVTDAVFPKEKATALAQQAQVEGDTVFSNDQDLLTESTPIDLAWFATAADKRSLVGKVPFNLTLVAVVAALLIVAVVGGTLYKAGQERQRKAELARIDAENDPAPKYQAALAAQRVRVGMDRAGTTALFAEVMKTPLAITGWKLKQIECSLDACGASWERSQGTFADAKQERPNDKLLIPSIDGQGRVTATALATIRTTLAMKPTVADVSASLPDYDAYVMATGILFQKWANAGIAVQTVPAAVTWPNVPGGDALRLPGMVSKGDFSISGINAVFGKELIGKIPDSVRIRKLVVHRAQDGLTLDLTGDFYVAK